MRNITDNEMLLIIGIFKSPEKEYNASNLARLIGISPMGALKIARKLEKDNILTSKKLGNARFYQLSLQNDYTKKFLAFLLKREAEQAPSHVKAWINEIRKITNADSAILFGSILKGQKAKDIDVLLITNQKRFQKLKKEINEINLVNIKKIHPIYQTKEDFKENIKKDKIILSAIKGIIVFGEDNIIKLVEK